MASFIGDSGFSLEYWGSCFFVFELMASSFFPKPVGSLLRQIMPVFFDIPLLGCAIPRRVVFLGRANLFPNRFLSRMLQSLGWIPLKTHRLDRHAFGVALDYLKAGTPVVIFPEGTRTEDGHLQPGRPGIGYLVAESQCEVIPAYISGTFKILPINAKWPRLHPVSISFGKSLCFSKVGGANKKHVYELIGRSVMDKVAQVGGVSPPYHDVS